MKPHTAPPTRPGEDRDARIASGNGSAEFVPTIAAQKAPDEELAVRADVEQAGPEPERDRQAGEDQRRGRVQRVGDGLGTAERSLEQGAVRRDRQGRIEGAGRADQPRRG